MIKNLTGQRWTVFAFDVTTGLPKTGDAANITANLRLDGGAANAVDDTNPTELEDGYYVFDITQAETNADHIIICPQSSTDDIIVIGVPGAVWTAPAKQAATLAAADVTGNLPVNVAQWKGATAPDNTGDAFARLGVNGAGLSAVPWNAAWDAEVQSECADALDAYDPPTNAEMNARTLVAANYATPTNITGGTITTVTNLTNAPTAGDFTTAMKTSLNAATPALSGTGVTAIATAVWANATRTLSSFGTLANDVRDAVWAATTRTLTAISDSAGITTLLSRIGTALSFTSGNVHVHVKAKDNLDFGALEKTSLNAATPSVTVSDKTDFALTSAYDAAKIAATQTSVNAIPTTSLLSTDARLDNLDATISSRLASTSYTAPPSASDIRSEIDINSSKLDVAISTRLAAIDYESVEEIEDILDRLDTMLEADGEDGNYKFTEAALAEAPVATNAPTVTEIRNEMDTNSTKLSNLDATVSSRLAATSYTIPPTAVSIRTEIDTNSTKLDAAISTRLAASAYEAPDNESIEGIKAKTDNLPASPAAVGSEMTLTSAYDAAKTAASQSSVNSIPTNPLLTNDARLNNLNATIASRLAADNYIAPANDNITAIKAVTDKLDDTLELEDGVYKFTEASLIDAPTGSASIAVEDIVDGVLDAKLSDHEEVGSVGAGIAAAGSAGDPWATELPGSYGNNTAGKIIGDNINATVASRLAAINYTAPPSASDIRTEIDLNSTKLDVAVGTRLATVGYTAPNNTDIGNIKIIADKLDTMLEADGSDYKFTEEALSEVPVASDAPTAIEIRNELDSNSTKLANLDTTISSRLAALDYNSPPTVAQIRNEMDNSSIKLANIDATISSRLAAVDYEAPPSVSDIRNEIDTNSIKLDVTISSRLATLDYSNPPTVTEIRNELDSNSTKLDVAVSTRLAGDVYEAPDNEVIADIKEIADIFDSLVEDSDGNRFIAKALEQAPITTLTVTDIVNGVLDEALLNHQQAGSVGAGISAAGSAGDPWATVLPGAYPEGTAGYVMGTNLLNPGTGNNIWLYRLIDEETTEPIIGALVVASTDIAGNIIIATAVTDARGIVRFNLNSGTYYLWRRHVNYEFTDPDIEVVP